MKENTTILDTFRFDFTYHDRDAKKLEELFAMYGYPNLKVDLSDCYEGFWKVFNSRNFERVWEGYHSGFVTFYKTADGLIKIEFNQKAPQADENKNSTTYFENNVKLPNVPDSLDLIKSLNEKIKILEEENDIYRRREEKIMEILKS